MVFARIYADNPAADVKPNTGAGATTYYMDSQQVAVTAAGSITLPERDASNSVVAEESFDILARALQGNTYAALLAGGTSAPPSSMCDTPFRTRKPRILTLAPTKCSSSKATAQLGRDRARVWPLCCLS